MEPAQRAEILQEIVRGLLLTYVFIVDTGN